MKSSKDKNLKWYGENAVFLNFRHGAVEKQWNVSIPFWYVQVKYPDFVEVCSLKEADKLYCDTCDWATKALKQYSSKRAQTNAHNSHRGKCKGKVQQRTEDPEQELDDTYDYANEDEISLDPDDLDVTSRNDESKATVKRTRSQSQSQKKVGGSVGSKDSKKSKKAEATDAEVPPHTIL